MGRHNSAHSGIPQHVIYVFQLLFFSINFFGWIYLNHIRKMRGVDDTAANNYIIPKGGALPSNNALLNLI